MDFLTKTVSALRAGLEALWPSCRDVSRTQCEELDHSLPPLRRAGLCLHLLICKWCRRYGRQIRFLSQAAHHHPDEMAQAVPEKLSDEARERIKRSLRD
jgi:hypothetical protein